MHATNRRIGIVSASIKSARADLFYGFSAGASDQHAHPLKTKESKNRSVEEIDYIVTFYSSFPRIFIRKLTALMNGERRMKNKTRSIAILAIALLSSMFMVTTVNATCVNLPTDPVTLVFTLGPIYPIELRLPGIATLSGVPAGYDVTNGPYTAYCVELGVYIAEGTPYSALLTCTAGLGSPWNEINYLLNNYADSLDVQMAIWRLLGNTEAFIIAQGWPFTVAAGNMYLDALAHSGFIPSPGDIVAVRCTLDGQDLLIKVEIPPEEGPPGFTPGFWKHNIGVYLGLNNGNYSAFRGGSLDGIKLTAAMLEGYAATIGVTLQHAYDVLSMGGGGAIAQARIDMANAFNAAAGYGPF